MFTCSRIETLLFIPPPKKNNKNIWVNVANSVKMGKFYPVSVFSRPYVSSVGNVFTQVFQSAFTGTPWLVHMVISCCRQEDSFLVKEQICFKRRTAFLLNFHEISSQTIKWTFSHFSCEFTGRLEGK